MLSGKSSHVDESLDSNTNPEFEDSITSETQVQNELFELEHEIDDMRHSETGLFGALSDDTDESPEHIAGHVSTRTSHATYSEEKQSDHIPDSRNKIDSTTTPASKKMNFDTGNSQPDDLKNIHGIGPVIEQSLNDLGINNYQQIASLTRREITEIAEILKIFPGRIERDNWVGSAKKLVAEEKSTPEDTKRSDKVTENA